MKKLIALIVIGILSVPAVADIYDQDVTPDVIFGDGNANGSFTVDQASGVELGLRAKLRHNDAGVPENTFNSNGDGTYTFQAGVAPIQSYPTAEWSFEWSINTNYDGSSSTSWALDDLTYVLAMTSTTGAYFTGFDPINDENPAENAVLWDHAIGDNSTGNGDGTVALDAADYANLIANNNVAQQSWKPHWFDTDFDPTDVGSYYFTLSAYNGEDLIADTEITVNAVPVPGAVLLGMLGLSVAGVKLRRYA